MGNNTFQNIVHTSLEAEAEVIRDLFGGAVHQLTGADAEDDGYEDGPEDDDDGYEDGPEDDDGYADGGAQDHAALMAKILDGITSADDEEHEAAAEAKAKFGKHPHADGYEAEHGADNANGTYTVESGDTLSSIAAAHGLTTAQLEMANVDIPNFDLIYPGQIVNLPGAAASAAAVTASATSSAPNGEDGYEEAPAQGEPVGAPMYDQPAPVPAASAQPPQVSPSGVTLGDILNVVGETAQATTAVAGAFRPQYAQPVHPVGYGPPVAVGVAGPPGSGWGPPPSEYGIHGHRMGRFAHERPVLFILAFATIMYFLFLSEDSVWEKVLHSGSKSRQHDKVETVTEEIHTRREAVLGKPTFPSPSTAPSAPMSSPSPAATQA